MALLADRVGLCLRCFLGPRVSEVVDRLSLDTLENSCQLAGDSSDIGKSELTRPNHSRSRSIPRPKRCLERMDTTRRIIGGTCLDGIIYIRKYDDLHQRRPSQCSNDATSVEHLADLMGD